MRTIEQADAQRQNILTAALAGAPAPVPHEAIATLKSLTAQRIPHPSERTAYEVEFEKFMERRQQEEKDSAKEELRRVGLI